MRMGSPWSGLIGPALLLLLVLAALLAPLLAPGDPLDMVARPLTAPFTDARFPLGTDQLGRDVWAGLVHGARVSLVVGLAAAAATLGAGILVGTLAGFRGGFLDDGLMRLTEAFQTVPTFLLALAMVSVLGASAGNVILAIAISSWPPAARLVRAEVLRVKTLDYVDAARVAGMAPSPSPSSRSCRVPCSRSSHWPASPWAKPSWWRVRSPFSASAMPTCRAGARWWRTAGP
ncbi:MAG: ABC transporter permease [Geminicoccaceae bacterium]